jgi:transposase
VRRYVEPDWASLAREMKRPGVNLMILWEEYQQVHPEGYGYSRYVAARVMWRRQGKDRFPRHAP